MVKEPCSQMILLNFLCKDNNSSILSFPTSLIIETIEKKKGICSHLWLVWMEGRRRGSGGE